MIKRLTVLVLALGLSGCGFRPLYGRYGADPDAAAIFAQIYIPPIASDEAGYNLRNTLIDLLRSRASSAGARYRLSITLAQSRQGIAIEPNATITRYNYQLNARYTLYDLARDKIVTSGSEEALSAYNVPLSSATSLYSTLMARRDAQRRAAEDVAQRIRMDLAVFFAEPRSRS